MSKNRSIRFLIGDHKPDDTVLLLSMDERHYIGAEVGKWRRPKTFRRGIIRGSHMSSSELMMMMMNSNFGILTRFIFYYFLWSCNEKELVPNKNSHQHAQIILRNVFGYKFCESLDVLTPKIFFQVFNLCHVSVQFRPQKPSKVFSVTPFVWS